MNYIKEIRLSDLPHGEYPFNIPAVRHLKKAGGLSLNKPVTFLVGENGTGKSTLIEAIAVAMGFNAEGGSRDFYFNTRIFCFLFIKTDCLAHFFAIESAKDAMPTTTPVRAATLL